MSVLRRVEPISAMKIGGVLYAIFGLLAGAMISVLAMLGVFSSDATRGQPAFFSALFGGLAIVIFPIFYGVLGAIMAGLGAALYNVAARFVGGLVVDVG